MKVSVIIPTYNEEGVIGECLESLKSQSQKSLEVIVVDDGSTDATLDEVKRHTTGKTPIVVLRQQHKGPGEARNLGAKKAKGEILVFVDADMTFDKDFVVNLVEPVQKGVVKGTFSKEEFVSNWDSVWARCWNINEGWEEKKRHPNNYPSEQKVFRAIAKSEFDKVGGFERGGHYTDDWSLSKKLGYGAQVVRGAKFYHKNPDNLGEIYNQAKWIGKREYKLGIIGTFYALLRSTLPVSIVVGLVKAVVNTLLAFVVFKAVYDFGIFVGILEYALLKKKGR